MVEGRVIIDTGPIVAFLVEEDGHHEWAVGQFKRLRAPMLTCEAVLTEAFFLVHRLRGGVEKFVELLESGVVEVGFELMGEREAVGKLMRKYADLPMSLADGCLVRMAELHAGAAVLTLDRHFRIYRKNGRQRIGVIMPGEG